MSAEENKTIIQRYIKDFSECKTDKMNEFIADDYVYHGPGGYEIKGIEGLKKLMAWVHNIVPTQQFTIDDLIAEGDKVVTFFTIKGADKRNKQINLQAIMKSRLAGGKVVEDWEIFDRFEMASQLAPGWARVMLNFMEKQMEKDRP